MRTRTMVLAITLALGLGAAAFTSAAGPKASALDTKPGPAFRMVDGKLNKIDGNVYVVEEYTGNELRLYVSKDTKKLRGEKKPGDLIRAEVTKGWHANSIQ